MSVRLTSSFSASSASLLKKSSSRSELKSRFMGRLHWWRTICVSVIRLRKFIQLCVLHVYLMMWLAHVLAYELLPKWSSSETIWLNVTNQLRDAVLTSCRCGTWGRPQVCWTRLQVSAPSLDLWTKDTHLHNRYSSFTSIKHTVTRSVNNTFIIIIITQKIS